MLTVKELSQAKCASPNCTHDDCTIYLHGRCHIDSPTWTYYDKKSEFVVVECATCRKKIAQIKVSQ